jgi:hypothetical protein
LKALGSIVLSTTNCSELGNIISLLLLQEDKLNLSGPLVQPKFNLQQAALGLFDLILKTIRHSDPN